MSGFIKRLFCKHNYRWHECYGFYKNFGIGVFEFQHCEKCDNIGPLTRHFRRDKQ